MAEGSVHEGHRTLASGNVLRWQFVRVGNKGAMRAAFRSKPTEDDTAEADTFLRSLIPAGAGRVQAEVVAGRDSERLMIEHLRRNDAGRN